MGREFQVFAANGDCLRVKLRAIVSKRGAHRPAPRPEPPTGPRAAAARGAPPPQSADAAPSAQVALEGGGKDASSRGLLQAKTELELRVITGNGNYR